MHPKKHARIMHSERWSAVLKEMTKVTTCVKVVTPHKESEAFLRQRRQIHQQARLETDYIDEVILRWEDSAFLEKHQNMIYRTLATPEEAEAFDKATEKKRAAKKKRAACLRLQAFFRDTLARSKAASTALKSIPAPVGPQEPLVEKVKHIVDADGDTPMEDVEDQEDVEEPQAIVVLKNAQKKRGRDDSTSTGGNPPKKARYTEANSS